MPASPRKGLATIISPSSGSSKISCLSSPRKQETKQCVVMPGMKRDSSGQPLANIESSPSLSTSLSAPLHTMAAHPEAYVSIKPDLFLSQGPDSFVNSLSDNDMETSLNFLNDFGMDFLISDEPQLNHNLAATNADSYNDSNSVPDPSHLKEEDIACGSPPASELHAIKLFDEIYEHYFNTKDSPKTADSPNPSINSDSGVGSDVEPMSPLSNVESLNDDFWHDLFPGLQ
ncbi:hypothetical protein PoB_003412800 [Plakobranchus ocellatus]|uniref:Uncharacterized protein n=1 Tax=Plakobranchus ocellatus TaxID=259542 RepID=A0AAV4ALD4_9GAST|nr:hypothetical protein PoB_003412800 [Plakobranchus ocellatus]